MIYVCGGKLFKHVLYQFYFIFFFFLTEYQYSLLMTVQEIFNVVVFFLFIGIEKLALTNQMTHLSFNVVKFYCKCSGN